MTSGSRQSLRLRFHTVPTAATFRRSNSCTAADCLREYRCLIMIYHDLTPKKQTWQQTERVTTGPQPQDLNQSCTPRKMNLTNVSRPQIHASNQPEDSHKKVPQTILFRKTRLIQCTKSNSHSNTTVTAIGGEHISGKKLSKSQAKRLRKKRRDAQVVAKAESQSFKTFECAESHVPRSKLFLNIQNHLICHELTSASVVVGLATEHSC